MRRHRRSIWTNCALSITVCAILGWLMITALTALFSAFTYYLMDSMALSRAFTVISICGGAFGGGYICGRFRRRRGLVEGLMCGAVMYLLLIIVGAAAVSGIPPIKKLLQLAVSCAAGGVTGVNSKRPKRLTGD